MIETIKRLMAHGVQNSVVAWALGYLLQRLDGVVVTNDKCRNHEEGKPCRIYDKKTNETPEQTRETHTPEELKRMADFAMSVDAKAVDWYEKVLSATPAERVGMSFKYGICDDKMANDIKRIVGIDTKGWVIEIQGNTAAHINKRHGKNGQHDRSMANPDDFGRIGFAIRNYDAVQIIEPSKAYLQNQGKYSPQIALLTKVDGTMVVSEAVPNTKKKTIQITTAYFTKEKSRTYTYNRISGKLLYLRDGSYYTKFCRNRKREI